MTKFWYFGSSILNRKVLLESLVIHNSHLTIMTWLFQQISCQLLLLWFHHYDCEFYYYSQTPMSLWSWACKHIAADVISTSLFQLNYTRFLMTLSQYHCNMNIKLLVLYHFLWANFNLFSCWLLIKRDLRPLKTRLPAKSESLRGK